MRPHALFLVGILLMSTAFARAADERGELIVPEDRAWLEATSIEAAVERWPDRIDLLLDPIDLEQPALAAVKAAADRGDRAAACEALLRYYADNGRCEWILGLLPEPNEHHVRIADDLLDRKVRLRRKTETIPAEHGAWDWNHTGPKGNREFAFSLNRHSFFRHLLLAYRKTGEEKYARAFDRIVRDWTLHTVYPGEDHAYVWTWRVLEAALRMRSWLPAFHGFLQSEGFSPAGRLLMLSSFVQHGRYIRMHHWNHHNHALMEFDGLNRLGLALPELKQADGWHRYAFKQMLEEMEHQVYPDGAHDELSSGYHWVSLHSFEQLAEVCRAAGETVPDTYRRRLIDMYDYWVGLVRPDGSLPQNNRSDRGNATRRILAAAERYDRPDWRYIVTNGAEGERPAGPPSRMAPYAGHLVSRGGWDADALWSFFDVGPAGAGWVHADALHLSVTAFGKDFLVDSGRFWYMRDQWTRFAHSSRSHNVILIDDHGQKTAPKKTSNPLADKHRAITDAFDFARGTHDRFDDDLDGEAAHTRIVVFLRDAGAWVVVDRITTDRPRSLTAMWRFRPERKVQLQPDGSIITDDPEGANLSITPVGPVSWQTELVRGQEEPYLQGWYSESSPEWTPNTCAELRAEVEDDAVFAWVILPRAEGPASSAAHARCTVDGDAATVRFDHPDRGPIALTVPLDAGRPQLEQDQ